MLESLYKSREQIDVLTLHDRKLVVILGHHKWL